MTVGVVVDFVEELRHLRGAKVESLAEAFGVGGTSSRIKLILPPQVVQVTHGEFEDVGFFQLGDTLTVGLQ